MAPTTEELLKAQKLIDDIILEKNCGPIFVRLAWHDSGTFDKDVQGEWPAAGGANGSIRFAPEINHGANAGLINAVKLLEPVKEACPTVSYADIFQMSSARAIALAGGPAIDMKYGRLDTSAPEQCPPEGNLPDGNANPETQEFGGAGGTKPTVSKSAEGHLRAVFHRMGLSDEDIVALSGAHTLGRAYKDRSGEGAESTKFTTGPQTRADGTEANYKKGGSSWTTNFLQFDNSYFKIMSDESADPELLKLATDKIIFVDPDFKPFAEKFRDDQDAFFQSYAAAHKKLSELGSKFEPAEGIKL
ncbi:L-ascorbate peroxidase [Fistulifera solaris]|uniref:L-ascorbate peroxidase n=1 Tax=Fistulifera solaris TaxID=1519565 RepID=A0A1Z5JSX1_FISSO|nr:L-ascorbate peroxidase [Fistulifera solaris]|eukprot:GAX16878.1 L-ascorbate peroxidase [Fistulifera solaris]